TPAIMHRALSALARLVSWRVLPSLTPLSRLMDWAVDHLSWGEHRGGMFVELHGAKNGEAVVHRWHLVAEQDRGPFIPSLAANIILRGCLEGRRPASGARPAHLEVSLADYERHFAELGIATVTL